MAQLATGRDFLVLWRWKEALRIRGTIGTGAWGKHSGGLKRGDRIFVWATNNNELYLLGAMEVERSGDNWMKGHNLYGPYQIIPLKGLKWKLHFQQAHTEKLSPKSPIAMQVRARRRPTPETARLLEQILSSKLKNTEEVIRLREGKFKIVTLNQRERNRKVRAHAIALRGDRCEICEFDFAEKYGAFAKNCVEVHHLNPVSSAGKRGRMTTVDDLIVVCPNCHRALHQFKTPGDWKAFQRTCHLA